MNRVHRGGRRAESGERVEGGGECGEGVVASLGLAWLGLAQKKSLHKVVVGVLKSIDGNFSSGPGVLDVGQELHEVGGQRGVLKVAIF